MRSKKSNVTVISSCSWCCGDLRLVNLPDGPQIMCAHCGRAAPRERQVPPGAMALEGWGRIIPAAAPPATGSTAIADRKSA